MKFIARRYNHHIFLLGILLLALALRLVAISARPLWYDEAIATLIAEKGPDMILYSTLTSAKGSASNVHPPAYFILLWGWIKMFGNSLIVLRSLSVLFGLGVLALAYGMGELLFDTRLALLSAGLIALSPFHIHYAQEVRMYALLTFFIMVATYALWRGMQEHHWRWWLLFTVCSALAQYTHNLAAFYLILLALIPLIRRDWFSLRSVIVSGLGALVVYLPWLVHLPAQFAKVRTAYWVARPTPARFITTLLSFVINLPLPDSWLPLGLFVTLTITSLGAWQTFRSWRTGHQGVRSALWMAYLAFIPPLFLYFFSLWQPVFIERALLPAGVFFLLWLSWSLARTNLPQSVMWFVLGLMLIGMTMGIFQHVTYRGFPYGPYQALSEYLVSEMTAGDRIVHSNKLTMLPMAYYDRDLPQHYVADVSGSGSDTLALPTQKALGLVADPDIQSAVGNAERIWFVIFSQAIDEYQSEGYLSHPHILWLKDNFDLCRVSSWADIELYFYAQK
jgi:4-amino-4-deoxy-L-arabinose transferase-like glycosyltransferase